MATESIYIQPFTVNSSGITGIVAQSGILANVTGTIAYLSVNTAANLTWSGSESWQGSDIGVTPTTKMTLFNAYPASNGVGNQQYSPSMEIYGNGWASGSGGSPQNVGVRFQVVPVQGVTNPTASLQFDAQINGSYTTNIASLNTSGVITTAADAVLNGVSIGRGAGGLANCTIIGQGAGSSLTSSPNNTAVGGSSLTGQTDGGSSGYNTAIGYFAMRHGNGINNTCVGGSTLSNASFSGSYNTVMGYFAGSNITTGSDNTIIGNFANGVTTGSCNLIISVPNSDATHYGGNSVTTASNVTLIGAWAGANTSNLVAISDGSGNVVFSNQVSVVNYGTTTTLTANDGTSTIMIGAASTGAATVNLPTGTNAAVGTEYTIGDIGANASTYNITIDAGSTNSNKIVGATSAQTYVISNNGGTVILQKVSASQWKILSKF